MLALAERPTASFAYIRWMGPNRDIVDYSRIQHDRTRELEAWAQAIRSMPVREIYGYVNNLSLATVRNQRASFRVWLGNSGISARPGRADVALRMFAAPRIRQPGKPHSSDLRV